MIFKEKQNMRQLLWVMIPLGVTIIIMLGFWVVDRDMMAEGGLLNSFLIIIGLEALLTLMFLSMALKTTITEKGVTMQYQPLIRKTTFLWSNIKHAWVREYKPIREFGGWGFRGNLLGKGRAYNVWGNKGLQLELKNGRRVLIGTQKPEEMAAFLKLLKQKYNIAVVDPADLPHHEVH